jgi:hypothetical protein
MESWRGQGRRAGRDALGRLAAAWKAGSEPGGPGPDGQAGGQSRDEINGALGRVSTPDRRENTARDYSGGARVAAARSRSWGPVGCDSARMSRYPHRACKQ